MEAIKLMLEAAHSNRHAPVEGNSLSIPEFDGEMMAKYVDDLTQGEMDELCTELWSAKTANAENTGMIVKMLDAAVGIVDGTELECPDGQFSTKYMANFIKGLPNGDIDELCIELYTAHQGYNQVMAKMLKASKGIDCGEATPSLKGEVVYMAGMPAPGEQIDACGADGPWKYMGVEECREIFGEGWEG